MTSNKIKRIAIILVATLLTSTFVALNIIKPVDSAAANNYKEMISISYTSQDELEEKRRERDAALAAAKEAAEQVEALSEQAGTISTELGEMNQLNEEQQKQYEIISAQYAAALTAKAIALDNFVNAQDSLKATQLQFSRRLSVMFEYQNKSVFEILLESDSVAGFFTNLEMIQLIAEADDQAVDQMERALSIAETEARNALAEADALEQFAEEKKAELDALEQGIELTQEQLDAINESIKTWEESGNSASTMVATLDGQIAYLEAQIAAEKAAAEEAARKAAEEAAKATETTEADPTPVPAPSESDNTEATDPTEVTEATESTDPTESTEATESTDPTESTEATESEETTETTEATPTPSPTPIPTPTPSGVSGNGMMIWPLYKWDYVSDEFGYRYHPIYGDWRGHKGMDISSKYGNTVIAAAGGTVYTIDYPYPDSDDGGSSGYGNMIIIDHGNGVYSLYGHLRSIYVTSGQSVSQGEAIGEVGSTGGSTGSHLHFEVRTGGPYGTAVNPREYL